MTKLTKKELKIKKMRLKKLKESRELKKLKMSKLKSLNLSGLENVLFSKYGLALKQFISDEQDYFTMTIKSVPIEVVLDNKQLKAGVNLGQMNHLKYEIPELFSVIEKMNKTDPLHGSIIQLEEMDNFYYLRLQEALLEEDSTEETIFDLIEYLIEIAKSSIVLNSLARYIE
jgi:hypothetical protein